MTRQEHLEFCKKCLNRKMDVNKGIICNITGDIADFEDSCENFKLDETVKEEVRIEERSATQIIAELPANIKDKLRPHQDLQYAIVGGLFISIICGILWAAVTVITGYQIGYMAIGVGLGVGMGVRYFGAGIDLVFGIIGAALALIGCLIGNLLSQVGFIADIENLSYFQTLTLLNLENIILILQDSFSPMDLVFYGIAGYEGYRFAFRSIPDRINETDDLTPAYSKLRLPLVIVCFIAISVTGYTISRGANGNHTFYYENGAVMSSGEMSNGVENGEWIYYYQNGKPQVMAMFENGVENGRWEWFFESGGLMRSGTFVNGLTNGPWFNYHQNGQLSDSSNYKIGRLDGYSVTFYENGQISQKGEFKRDKPIGTWRYWSENGNPITEIEFNSSEEFKIINAWNRNGDQTVTNGNGTYLTYYDSGELLEKGIIKHGEKVSVWITYFKNGEKKEEAYFKENEYYMKNAWSETGDIMVKNGTGEYIRYFENSAMVSAKGLFLDGKKDGFWQSQHLNSIIIEQEAYFKKGKLNGENVTYYPNGNVAAKGEFREDERIGEWAWYYESGVLQCTVNYKDGLKVGSQIFWSESGKKNKEEIYQDGELVEERLIVGE
jgi:antitoxin component YwqK of YwqJK toxin-antitoxin module